LEECLVVFSNKVHMVRMVSHVDLKLAVENLLCVHYLLEFIDCRLISGYLNEDF
jgi:hypothetical protein